MYPDEQRKQFDEADRQHRAFQAYRKEFPDRLVLIHDRHHFYDHAHYENFLKNFKVK